MTYMSGKSKVFQIVVTAQSLVHHILTTHSWFTNKKLHCFPLSLCIKFVGTMLLMIAAMCALEWKATLRRCIPCAVNFFPSVCMMLWPPVLFEALQSPHRVAGALKM